MSLRDEYTESPLQSEVHLRLADEYERSGDLEQALAECDKALSVDHCLADAYNLRGIILEKMGLDRSAVRAYKKALRYDPDFKEAKENLATLEEELHADLHTMQYASFWRRVTAGCIDGIIIVGVWLVISPFVLELVQVQQSSVMDRLVELIRPAVDWVAGILMGYHLDEDNLEAYIVIWMGALFFMGGIAFFMPTYLVYSVLMESSSRQATLGKEALGITVTDIEGHRVSLPRAGTRNLLKPVSLIPLFIGSMFTDKNQGVHDIVSESLVVMKR